jgi:HAD superfamily hydrolase (TIGR01549 family)
VIPAFPVYLFDIDGTLLDSATDICGAVQQVLDAACPERSFSFEYLKSYVGLNLNDLFQDIFPECTAERCEEMFQQYRVFYRGRRHAGTRVFPGVAEGLAALGGRKSTATSKGTPFSRLVLEQFGLLPYFDHVQGTDGFPSKPAPDLIFTALRALGASPRDCLFVGDSVVDMEAGRRAGVATCAVRYGYGNQQEMTPDYWIDDLREL